MHLLFRVPDLGAVSVEDDELVRDMLAQVLERSSHKVIKAQDGEDATEILKTLRPDIIITDIIMPKKSGTGVIIGRFQVFELNDVHEKLIGSVQAKHAKVMVFLGTSPAPSLYNPLDWELRDLMFKERYHEALLANFRAMSLDRRLAVGMALLKSARRMRRAALHQQHPAWRDDELDEALRRWTLDAGV